jgi:soluble lytic murein transglycosylase-like protein
LRSWLLTAALLAVGGSVHAEIALLSNGQTLKVTEWREEGTMTFLTLKDGGEIGTPSNLVQGFVPDEVIDEVLDPPPAEPGEKPRDLRSLAEAAARRHGLNPALVLAVVSVESAFRPDAVSPKGAQGLMQLMPHTAASLGVRDAFDPEQNLEGGAKHLQDLVTLYSGDLTKALAAYNAGAGAVSRHGGVPPYPETLDYIRRVLRQYQVAVAEAKK